MRTGVYAIVWPVTVLGLLSGCATTSATPKPKGPLVAAEMQRLQIASAGYTGCMPTDNAISNDGIVLTGEVWNATCNGKVYLCSAIAWTGDWGSATMSCAPVAR
jgi:hypothetical protein